MAYDSDITLRAIADPRRRAILDALREGDLSVSDLTERFDVSQPAISQHLAVLKEAGLVRDRKAGRQRIYSVDAAPLVDVARWVATYEAFWDDRLDALAKHLRQRNT
ncbi:MAG: metalloregulator ArsR/SmtB family transcription factor [Pseudomonadota bacterium]